MSFMRQGTAVPDEDGTEDSLLGTIVLLWGLLLVALIEAGRELVSGGLGAITNGSDGPYFGILRLAGIPFLGVLLAVALGSTRPERLPKGLLVAGGLGLITVGLLAGQLGLGGRGLGGPGWALIVAGVVVLVYFVFSEGRARRGLPEGRLVRPRFVLFGLWAAYAAASLAIAGSIHLAILLFLAWQVSTPVADAYASLRERMRPAARPEEDHLFEEFVPVAVAARFTPEQQEIVDGIIDFIGATYESKWPNPTIREAVEAPAFTTYILDKPDIVEAARFIGQVDNLAIKLGVSEQGLDIVVSGKKRGLLIQIAKPREAREILWFDDFTAKYGAPPPDRPFQVVLGEDSFGQPIYADVGSPTDPHMLICGTTRSGKTIMMHNILCQLFINNSPDDLQLAVIDPKMVSGQLYAAAGAPHLWAPVVIDADMVPVLMSRVEEEMNRRYRLMTDANVTKLSSYNRKHPEDKVPALVFLMDEVASLTGDEGIKASFEKHVGAIAMKGGAAGVFLILGVQRPSQRNLSENVRGLLNQRIVFKLNSLGESTMALASGKDDPAAMRLGGSGDGYFVLSGERTRFIGAYLPEEDDKKWSAPLEKTLKEVRQTMIDHRAQGASPDVIAGDEAAIDFIRSRLETGLTVDSQIAAIVRKWGTRKLTRDLGSAPASPVVNAAVRAQLAGEHNSGCSDREWLVLTGLRLALAAESDPYETRVFTPESLEPFVARAADGYGYREGVIEANEIHKALGHFFPDPRTGGQPKLRDWAFNRAMIEPSKYDVGLVGRFAADPTSIPPLPGVIAIASSEGPSVEDIANRDRRDY